MDLNGYFKLSSSNHSIGMKIAINSIDIIESFPNLDEFVTDYIILPENVGSRLQLKKFSLCTALTHGKFYINQKYCKIISTKYEKLNKNIKN